MSTIPVWLLRTRSSTHKKTNRIRQSKGQGKIKEFDKGQASDRAGVGDYDETSVVELLRYACPLVVPSIQMKQILSTIHGALISPLYDDSIPVRITEILVVRIERYRRR